MNNNSIHTYPVILRPFSGASVVKPSNSKGNSKKKKHGQSELIAFARFFKYGCGEILEDVCVKIDGHNYEPDFAYINKEKGIFIDIEIDEPYSAAGHPTHFMHEDGVDKDSARNKRFQESGWYVLRFSEEQIICHTRECLKEIYKLALEAGTISELPQTLRDTPDLQQHPRWTKNDAFLLSRKHHRKSYLGYDPVHIDLSGALSCLRLLIPVIRQSITHSRVRSEMVRQLQSFLFR